MGALLLLVAVLIPGVGKVVNGARRWLSIGPIGFQPSEVAKFAVLIYAADYMVRKMEVKERFFRAVLPMGAAVAIVGVLLLAEPDMGAFMVVAVIAMGIPVSGGGECPHVLPDCWRAGGAFALMIASSPGGASACLRTSIRSASSTPGQGLPAVALADRHRARRGFGVGLGGSVESCTGCPRRTPTFCWP